MSIASSSTRNSTIVLEHLTVTALRLYFRTLSSLHPRLAVRQAARLFTLPPRYAGRRGHPADARLETVTAGEHNVALWQAGPATAPAVLLVHGWGGRGVQMGGFAAPLLARGLRVVWLDLPGHGESGSGPVAMPDMVRAVRAVAALHGPFHAAVGHSFGAAVLAMALRQGLPLARVAFISPPASMQEHTHRFARLLGISAPVRQAMRQLLERRHGLSFAEVDRLEDLARVTTPALLVHDSLDAEVPFEHARRLAAHLPGARLVRTHGLGHYRILRDAAVLAAVADFIAGVDAPLPAELPALPRPAPLY